MMDYEYFYEQYRRVPRNSATTHRDLLDFHSTGTLSTYNIWSGALKRPITTSYIDGSKMLGLNERPYSMKGLFPKGKGRQRSAVPCEKKINTGDAYMSLVPAEKTTLDGMTARSERTRSPLSMATATQFSTLPDVQRKSVDIRSNRMFSATIYDDENSDAKMYGRCATTHANGGWVRRYKSINESQTLTDILRDQKYRDEVLRKKRSCHQLFLLSSSTISSFNNSFTKHRRAKC